MNAVASRVGDEYYGVMELAKKLNKLLSHRRMSKRELARAAKVAPGTVQNACNGKDMWLSNAIRVARVLGVPLDYLADEAQDDPPAPAISADQSQMLEVLESIGITSPIDLMKYVAGRSLPQPGDVRPVPPPSRETLRPVAVRDLDPRDSGEPGRVADSDHEVPPHARKPGRRE